MIVRHIIEISDDDVMTTLTLTIWFPYLLTSPMNNDFELHLCEVISNLRLGPEGWFAPLARGFT